MASREALTDRELQVARLAAAGRTDKEIGAALGIRLRTAGAHMAAVRRKLGIRSRLLLVDWLREHDQGTPCDSTPQAGPAGWDAETAAYMARRAVCRRCGDHLVPSPTAIGRWITDRDGIGRGVCPDGNIHDAQRTDGAAPTAGEATATAGKESSHGC